MPVIDVDFKDRNGKWVLRTRQNEEFIQTRLGRLHNNVTQRAKKQGSYQAIHNTYEGVTISELFQDAQKFCDWVVEQPGWGLGYSLDKDLLIPGNREYSETSCVFLPNCINVTIQKSRKNGTLGAYKSSRYDSRWFSKADTIGGLVYLGTFPTAESASEAYVEFKELYVKTLAEKYKSTIDPRAFDALMSWTLH